MATSGAGKVDQGTRQPNFSMAGAGEGGREGRKGSYVYDDDGLMDSDDALTAEFRHRLGLLPEEEEGLTEAFKQRIGLASDGESSRELSEVVMPVDIEKEATLSRFKFSVFVKNNFQAPGPGESISSSFFKEPLKQPLLAKKSEIDKMASAAVSTAIKRFCGDISFSKVAPAIYADGTPVMSVVFTTIDSLSRRLQRSASSSSASSTSSSPALPSSSSSSGKPPVQAQNSQEHGEKSAKKYSLKRLFRGKSSKLEDGSGTTETTPPGVSRSVSRTSSSGEDATDLTSIAGNIPTADLDLVQYIVGHGILRRDLRDEIYCQLCCQVTKNPTAEGIIRGWILHVLCACCFMPSEELLKYYFSFLNEVAAEYKEYGAFAKRMLHRTSSCGLRYHPPTWLEYQATRKRKHIMVPVSLPDGRSVSIECDSAMTASEMCHKVSTSVKLRDQFGFSIYIVVKDKVSSMGNGSDHVMDAIAECEQLMRCHGKREEESPWQLFFRKELFTPWHDAENDPVATNLIYQQIVHSVLAEEYRLRSEEEAIRFVARRWYIEQGQEVVSGRLQSMLHEFLPKSLLSSAKSRDGWTQAIIASFNELGFSDGKKSKEDVKGLIVDTAQRKWPLQFSALFESYRVGGPPLARNEVVFAVNCRGVFFIDEPYRILMALHYYEIVDVVYARKARERGPTYSVITIRGDEWTFLSPNAETITKLLSTFLDGLRRRSRWAVAIQEFILQDHTRSENGMFRIVQGDVLELLDETQQKYLKEDWMYGRCERTGQVGSFPFDCVYIFPTCEKPPADFLAVFTVMSSADVSTLPRKRGAVVIAGETIGRHAGHGLQSAI